MEWEERRWMDEGKELGGGLVGFEMVGGRGMGEVPF